MSLSGISEHGWNAAGPTLKPGHRRSQHEREKDGERDRHKYGLRPVQDDHDEYTPGERHPPPQCLRRIIHKARPFLRMCGAGQRGKVAPASICVAARGVRGRDVAIFA